MDSRILFFVILLCCFLSACTGNITPDPFPPQTKSTRYLLVLVHGSGDTATDWPAELIAKVQAVIADLDAWDIVAYDWGRYAADKASASTTGLAIGRYIGEQLAAAAYCYDRIQLIGHSVGSFVVQGVCDAYRTNGGTAWVHLTFLDPFTGKGFVDWTYGQRRFGEGADFAEAYLNTDDPVPSTNSSLSHAHNFDVTALAPDLLSSRDRHWWPVLFYIESIEHATGRYGYPLSLMATGDNNPVTQSEFPVGKTTILSGTEEGFVLKHNPF
ncbi:MAG: alpha/beta hydrolase [Desulfobacterota bacterium]|nr:alpha/beta hydrolase [Thermodesulfobacteriota bacterium]